MLKFDASIFGGELPVGLDHRSPRSRHRSQMAQVPASTPKEIIAKLAAALDKALDDPSVRERIAELGGSIPAKQERTPVSFARLVKAEIARWSPILKAASVTTN